MINYPFSSIFINNREVELAKIVSEEVLVESDFEKNTFAFIRAWLRGETEFRQNTSGSTGKPKEIVLTREHMYVSAKLTEVALQLKQGYNALVCLDARYIAGKMMLVRCFVTGMKIIAINPASNPLRELNPNHRIDFVAFVPYQLQEMLSSQFASRLNTIRTAIIGGAAIDHATKEMLQLYSCECYATYGMTETVSHIALQKLNGESASENFQTLPGIEIKVDHRKCLVIKGPNFKAEIQTNDIAEIISEKEFRLIGRYDNVINSGGIKVSPEKLEAGIGKVFKKLKIDRSFFVTGVPDKKLGERIVLIVEGDPFDGATSYEINSMFKQMFTLYEVPKEIIFKKEFIFTDTYKINRQKTIDLFEK